MFSDENKTLLLRQELAEAPELLFAVLAGSQAGGVLAGKATGILSFSNDMVMPNRIARYESMRCMPFRFRKTGSA